MLTTSPAVQLFAQLHEMIGLGGFEHTADVLAELRERFGFDVAWRPTEAGPTAEVVEATGERCDSTPEPETAGVAG